MFEDLGLNVARQADNGANPRPDNRSGWLSGETPDVISAAIAEPLDAISAAITEPPPSPPALEIRLWDPSTQLRYAAKRAVPPRPDGAPNRTPSGPAPTRRAA
jgi:biotin synthase